MKKKLVLIATMVVASSLSLDTNEAQAQSWRDYNRGLNTRVYSYPANRSLVNSNRSYAIQMFTPYSAFSSGFRNFGGYGVPSRYGYGNNFGNSFGYGFPSGNVYRGGFDNRSNFNNYGFGPSLGNRYSRGMSGYGTW